MWYDLKDTGSNERLATGNALVQELLFINKCALKHPYREILSIFLDTPNGLTKQQLKNYLNTIFQNKFSGTEIEKALTELEQGDILFQINGVYYSNTQRVQNILEFIKTLDKPKIHFEPVEEDPQ